MKNDSIKGKNLKIYFKRVTNRFSFIFPSIILMVLGIINFSCQSQNRLTKAEAADGWILMFDGKSFNGWRGVNKAAFPETGWIIENGMLTCIGGRVERAQRGGDIIYDRKFLDFHLILDWKIAEAGNSGIFYLSQEMQRGGITSTGLEYQLLDNEKHPDSFQGVDGNHKAASLYDILPAVPQNCNPAGEWNTAEIIVKNGYVNHRQNGVDVVQVQIGTPQWDEMVEKSKFRVELFGKYIPGYIGLQDHGDDVWFRNIKIRPL